MALSKTGRFLSKAEISGVGVFFPFPKKTQTILKHPGLGTPKNCRDCETTIKIKFAHLRGGGEELGAERKIVQKRCFFFFRGKRHDNKMLKVQISGRPRFGSVRLRFGGGRVRAVPVFGSGGSSAKRLSFFLFSVQFNRKGRFRFRFLENGSGGSGSTFGFGKDGSDGSGFRFRFGS